VWKFEIGDDPAYSERNYDVSRWEQIHVPGTWENQGFPGYDGYAWNFWIRPERMSLPCGFLMRCCTAAFGKGR